MSTAINRRAAIQWSAVTLVAVLLTSASIAGFEPGKAVLHNMGRFSAELVVILPLTFVLVGLFEVWVKRETVERYLGSEAGFKGYITAVLLGGTTIGPAVVALPVAHTLHKKGADLGVIFTYIGAAAVCRIPMTLFEASCLGWRFTAVRYGVSIPLILLTGFVFGTVLKPRNYTLKNGVESE